jgi:hypothetical protein
VAFMITRSMPLRGIVTGVASMLAVPLPAQSAPARAQPTTGPVITSAGMALEMPNPTFTVPDDHQIKAVFLVNAGGGDTVRVNTQLTTLARFYNLHALNGIAPSRVTTAAVIFGGGVPAVLTDSAFAARFGGSPIPAARWCKSSSSMGPSSWSADRPLSRRAFVVRS